MSIMEGDEGWTDKNIKNCFYFQMGDTEKLGHRKIGTQKNWRTEKLRDREYTEILRNLERKKY